MCSERSLGKLLRGKVWVLVRERIVGRGLFSVFTEGRVSPVRAEEELCRGGGGHTRERRLLSEPWTLRRRRAWVLGEESLSWGSVQIQKQA